VIIQVTGTWTEERCNLKPFDEGGYISFSVTEGPGFCVVKGCERYSKIEF
jgi:hypothetical protein